MNLLRFYFQVGGEKFDAESFSLAAAKCGFENGTVRTTSNLKSLGTRENSRGIVIRKIFPGLTGTDGDVFFSWQTAAVNYSVERSEYFSNQSLGLTTESAQIWRREEEAMLDFLRHVRRQLPSVADYCDSQFFLLLKPVYGYAESDGPGGGHHFSENFIGVLAGLGAGLSIDSEPFELHFLNLSVNQK